MPASNRFAFNYLFYLGNKVRNFKFISLVVNLIKIQLLITSEDNQQFLLSLRNLRDKLEIIDKWTIGGASEGYQNSSGVRELCAVNRKQNDNGHVGLLFPYSLLFSIDLYPLSFALLSPLLLFLSHDDILSSETHLVCF